MKTTNSSCCELMSNPSCQPGEVSRWEAVRCLELIHQALDCSGKGEISHLLTEVGSLIEADYCACLLASPLSLTGSFASCSCANKPVDSMGRILLVEGTYPEKWLSQYEKHRLYRLDPVLHENYRHFAFQYWSDTYQACPSSKEFRLRAEEFGLKSGCSYGVRSGSGEGGSLFSFSGTGLRKHPHHEAILRWVVPHFHQVLSRFRDHDVATYGMSERELEVLKWLSVGKSSWGIGTILRISERTVNFHISNIFRKLDTVNRTQAVAVAQKLGLI